MPQRRLLVLDRVCGHLLLQHPDRTMTPSHGQGVMVGLGEWSLSSTDNLGLQAAWAGSHLGHRPTPQTPPAATRATSGLIDLSSFHTRFSLFYTEISCILRSAAAGDALALNALLLHQQAQQRLLLLRLVQPPRAHSIPAGASSAAAWFNG
jgi:hypothetical protein